jgi:hypothetical protein
MRLAQTDLEGIVRFLGEAGGMHGDEPFPPETLAALRRLVPVTASLTANSTASSSSF